MFVNDKLCCVCFVEVVDIVCFSYVVLCCYGVCLIVVVLEEVGCVEDWFGDFFEIINDIFIFDFGCFVYVLRFVYDFFVFREELVEVVDCSCVFI